MKKKTQFDLLLDQFALSGFPLVKSKEDSHFYYKNGQEEVIIIEDSKKELTIHLVKLDEEQNISYRDGFKYLVVEKDLDISQIIYFRENQYQLSGSWQFRRINNLDEGIEKLIINSRYKQKRRNRKGKSLTISPDEYKSILSDIWKVERKARSYRASVRNYLLNDLTESYSARRIKDTTSIKKGEFDFLVHRFNLKTKKNKKDYIKYLDASDLNSLQDLFLKMINNDVFDERYIKKLNNFFRKENLKEIIDLGNEILALGVTDLSTDKAKNVVTKVTDKSVVKLEGLWQEYFEQYLLLLIFSYKSIHAKVQLKNIDSDKKYPDFIGVNHYNGLDVIEIKTHLKRALTYDSSHDNFSFSSELSKAIIQTTNYMDQIVAENFKKISDKSKITSTIHPENLHRPRGIIIISSYNNLTTNITTRNIDHLIRDFTKLRNSLHNIQILTFDEILNTADEYLKHVI